MMDSNDARQDSAADRGHGWHGKEQVRRRRNAADVHHCIFSIFIIDEVFGARTTSIALDFFFNIHMHVHGRSGQQCLADAAVSIRSHSMKSSTAIPARFSGPHPALRFSVRSQPFQGPDVSFYP